MILDALNEISYDYGKNYVVDVITKHFKYVVLNVLAYYALCGPGALDEISYDYGNSLVLISLPSTRDIRF